MTARHAETLLATRCCACGRPLRDAKSVELGIGPVCRGSLGSERQVSEQERAEANALVHRIAARCRMTAVERERLTELGFQRLAIRLAERLLETATPRPIEIRKVFWRSVARIAVAAPYNTNALPAWRALGEWDNDARRWMIHRRDYRELLDMLKKYYPGVKVLGPATPATA